MEAPKLKKEVSYSFSSPQSFESEQKYSKSKMNQNENFF